MDFALTEEQAMIAETAKAFFAENATSARTRAAMHNSGLDPDLWRSFGAELGLAGIALPEEHGGAGLGMVELAIVAEAAGAAIAALPLLGHAMVGASIAAGGSDTQRANWLPQLATGEFSCAAAIAHSAPQSAGGALTGTLEFVPHGASASLLLVIAPEACWLVDCRQSGVGAVGHTSMDQTRPLATIALDNAVAEPLRPEASSAALSAGWICLSAEALGGAQEALDRTVAYSLERVQFGRPIGSFQANKHRLADIMVAIEQARSAVYWAACAIDEKSPEAALALHSAKAFCADTFTMAAGNMIQLHGGIGFTWEHDAHLFFKRARSISSLLFDSDWHRERIATLCMDAAA